MNESIRRLEEKIDEFLDSRDPVISAIYIVAMGFLYVHLSHGIGSVFQTLGLNTPRTQPFVSRLSRVMAILLAGAQ